MYIAHDIDGTPMNLVVLNTICPIEYATEARAIANAHLQNEGCIGETNLLPTELREKTLVPIELPIIAEATHIFCARFGYENTVRNQQATLLENWNLGCSWISATVYKLEDNPSVEEIKGKFCTVIGSTQDVLDYLNLEVI